MRGAAGTVAVEVSVNGGVDFTTDGREFVYSAPATAESLQPCVGIHQGPSLTSSENPPGDGPIRCAPSP